VVSDIATKMEALGTIKEVVTCQYRRANLFLEAGYILLDIQPTAFSTIHPESEAEGDKSIGPRRFVGRAPMFVLGRPEDVEPLTI